MSVTGWLPGRLPPWTSSAVVAIAAGVAGVAGSYGVAGFTPAFVVAPVEGTLSWLMPGVAVTFAITVLGDLGQTLNLALATVLVAGAFAVVAGLAVAAGRRVDSRVLSVAGTAAAVWMLAAAVTLRLVPALGAGVGAGLVVGVSELAGRVSRRGRIAGRGTTEDGNGRRRVVSALAAGAVAGAFGGVLGRARTAADASATGDDRDGDPRFDVTDGIAAAEERSFDIEGMDPAISEGFYQVDINSVDPQVGPDDWTLSVTGAADSEFDLSYDELREMDHEHRFVTLRCVGEILNGHKTDTALWTGVPLAPVVERAAPTSDCECVLLRAEDGFFQEFPLDALRPGMLAYGMNGRHLPRGHGAPVRALIPGHWGEINVKWLTGIEFLEREREGYWEKRGWHGTGPVNTVAKLHGKQRREDGRVVVGGHAYAGTRGISEVEVSVDGGPWETVELADRLPGASGPAADVGGGNTDHAADAWRSWRYVYDPPGGAHDVTVRAYERDGTRQPSDRTGPFSTGPSGWVTVNIDPSKL